MSHSSRRLPLQKRLLLFGKTCNTLKNEGIKNPNAKSLFSWLLDQKRLMILQKIISNKVLSSSNNYLNWDTSWKHSSLCIGTSVTRCRNFPPHLVATAIRCTSLGIRILCRSLPKEPHFITSDGTIVHLLWQQTPLFISRKWVSLTYLSSTFMGIQSEIWANIMFYKIHNY